MSTKRIYPPESSISRIGQGHDTVSIQRVYKHWGNLEVIIGTADIRQPTDWMIRDRRHAVIQHLHGHMNVLETELDGHGGSSGPPNRGELWSIPSEHTYRSYAQGGIITYLALYFDVPEEYHSSKVEIKAVSGYRHSELSSHLMTLGNSILKGESLETESLVVAAVPMLVENLAVDENLPVARSIQHLTREQCRRLRGFIFDSLATPISLSDLSAIAGLSTHHLLVAFRNAFGTTPSQFVIEQRLRAAQRLLLTTQHDITSIALMTGFSHHSHLTSTFQKRLGLSPSWFRSKYRNS